MERIEWLNARDLSSIDYEPKREPGDMQCHKWARASEPCNSIAYPVHQRAFMQSRVLKLRKYFDIAFRCLRGRVCRIVFF